MNERIQQLAEQAGLYVYTYKDTLFPSALTAEECNTAYNKFAELIIRDCASAAKYQKNPSLAILKHFGMED